MSAELLTSVDFKELLHPRTTPEMGFQSYEQFGGDGKERKAQQEAFLSGNVRNPVLDYPKLDEADQAMPQGIRRLEGVLSATNTLDEDARAVIWDSASYRMAEMYFVQQAALLNRSATLGPDNKRFQRAAADFKELNEQLYGAPEQEIVEMVLGEIWAQIDEKNLTGEAAKITDELRNGATLQVGEETVMLQPLPRSETRLPELDVEVLSKLREYLLEKNRDVVDMVQDYWDTVVVPRARAEEAGTDPAFEVADMEHLFKAVHDMRDPEDTSGVSIIVDPNASQLSWSTPDMAVKIGGKRSPIESPEDMTAKIIHEYIVHGGRAIKGLQTDMPALGTGLFTEADEGEDADYLTFEEGFASLCEIAMRNEGEEWKPLHVSRYLAIAMAYQGADFREIHETLWRVRSLMSINGGDAIPEKVKTKESKQAYWNCERTFRGTPSDMPSGERPAIAFTKDLGYLKGKISGMEYLKEHIDDTEAMDLLFAAKGDPLNHRQAAIVAKYAKGGK